MAQKITAPQKQIFENHISAYQKGAWDYTEPFKGTKEQFIAELKNGKTFKLLWEKLEISNCSITMLLMASPDVLNTITSGYRKAMAGGFKNFLNDLNIK